MTYLEKLIAFNKYLTKVNNRPFSDTVGLPLDIENQRKLMRSLMNTSNPITLPYEIKKIQDEILQEDLKKKGTVSIEEMNEVEDGIYLYQGDITRIKVDAIVNAANNKMLGCFVPLHNCIDNVIHSSAGLGLREECNSIMEKQGFDEPTGLAKITDSYNLPCKKVIHTVGPIVNGRLTQKHKDDLASCYQSSIKLAIENNLKSIAFCCISTGVFGFPQKEAAQIAVETSRKLKKEYDIKIILNTFKDEDQRIYEKLFR
jgi:O-acetyl-ADP-ribose deacetylase (regulator of RNase III)